MSRIILTMFMLMYASISYTQESRKEEPYFQNVYEKYTVTANIGIQGSYRVESGAICTSQGFPSIPINLDIFYRYTPANIFGYSGLIFELPFFNNNISENFYGGVSIGLGWYVFDHRDEFGYGWSMMQAFAGVFYVMNDHLGGGARLISRFNYSFHKNIALNLGLDLDYASVGFEEPVHYNPSDFFKIQYNIFSVGFDIGLTFYFNSN